MFDRPSIVSAEVQLASGLKVLFEGSLAVNETIGDADKCMSVPRRLVGMLRGEHCFS